VDAKGKGKFGFRWEQCTSVLSKGVKFQYRNMLERDEIILNALSEFLDVVLKR
jgi:hypothetical protein